MPRDNQAVAGGVREAAAEDVPRMAELADRKRQHYRDHAAPFQTPAANAQEIHQAFLPKLLEWDGFHVLVHEGESGVDGFIVGRFGSAPPPFGQGSLFHVDDFVVADGAEWSTAGRALLDTLVERGLSAGIEKGIVVSGPPSVDEPKTTFLREQWFEVEAEWWVKPVTPGDGVEPTIDGFDAAVGPAPPVYDPGGLTCLALEVQSPQALERFERFAAASQAVVAIVPNLVSRSEVREELGTRGYTVASEWYSKVLRGDNS